MKNRIIPPAVRSYHTGQIALVVCTILLVPLILTLLGERVDGNDWKWDITDFSFAGILLFTTGMIIDYIFKIITKPGTRIILCTFALLLLALIWAELAVGLFGTPIAGN